MRTTIVLLMVINAYSVAQDNYRPLKSYLGDYLSFISSDHYCPVEEEANSRKVFK